MEKIKDYLRETVRKNEHLANGHVQKVKQVQYEQCKKAWDAGKKY